MRTSSGVAIGSAAAVAIMLGLIWFIPPTASFSPANPSWNGLSQLQATVNAVPMENYSTIANQGEGEVLLIVGPSLPYTPGQVSALRDFLNSGGTLVLADDYGSGNSLLSGIGLNTTISGYALADPGVNLGNSELPVVQTSDRSAPTIALDYPSSLDIADRAAKVEASSSSFSYLDLNGTGSPSPRYPVGPFTVMATIPYAKGNVTLISDSGIFINAMMGKEDNTQLLKDLVAGKGVVLLDVAHWGASPQEVARSIESSAYSAFSRLDVRAVVLVASTAAFMFVTKREKRAPQIGGEYEAEVLAVLREHPGWDEATLRKLKEEMRRT